MALEITSVEFKKKLLSAPENLELIDVREKSEFDQIRIKGSKLIPMGELERRLGEIDWSKEVIFICRTGGRSGYVTEALRSAGYLGKNLAGGVHILSMNCQECMEQGRMDRRYFE
ncbi:MAG: rhodanese-like domain-containing protein [Candidatus Gracilibacteria bacterium]|nr:rhodanese-like domain-containing protein [Candidatus Gracilibacteria bacterium]